MERIECDVCIIGSGAGGGPLAHQLSLGGMRVVVLEKGPHHTEAQFVHDEIKIVRRDFFVPSPDHDPHVVREKGENTGRRSSMGWTASCVGGGTVHMAGYFYRLHPDDFRMASKYGASNQRPLADWPFSYDDLEPFYGQAERIVGVSGQTGANPFEARRSTPYPLPPVTAHPMAGWLDKACSKLGLHSYPSPRCIITRHYRGRQPCIYCDFCGSYGCEVGAKSSTLVALFPEALASGRCRIIAGMTAYRIQTDKRGRARSVLAHGAKGQTCRVEARVICVSAGAIESARLLLRSGLANGSGLVGKHLMFSISAGGQGSYRYADHPRRSTLEDRQPFLGRSLQDFYFLPPGVSELAKGGTIRFGFPHPNPIFRAIQLAHQGERMLWGKTLMQKIQREFRQQKTIEFETFQDFLPNPGTYVDLDPSITDPWGEPSARINLDEVPHHATAGAYLQRKGLEILAAAGADNLIEGSVDTVTGHLIQGTCRAGKDPANSVLDPFCRAHELPNLYVVDGSFMPHAGGVPTTLTILANSFRVAKHILERANRGDFK